MNPVAVNRLLTSVSVLYTVRFLIIGYNSQVPRNWRRGCPNSSLGVDRTLVCWTIPELRDLPMVCTDQLRVSWPLIELHPPGTFSSP